MRAVSVHQPWAWAILHAGKFLENRCWRTNYRGPLLIHAAATRASYDRVLHSFNNRYGVKLPEWERLPTSAILGLVELVDCVPASQMQGYVWAESAGFCWVLSRPLPFDKPIARPGRQLIYHVPDEIIPARYRA